MLQNDFNEGRQRTILYKFVNKMTHNKDIALPMFQNYSLHSTQ